VLFGFGMAIQPYPIPPCCVGCEVRVSPGCQFNVDWSTANGLSNTIDVFGILIWLMISFFYLPTFVQGSIDSERHLSDVVVSD
jgi:hypothetical protein